MQRLSPGLRILAQFLSRPGPVQITALAVAVLLVQALVLLLPKQEWLPSGADANSFLRALWQVHAAVLGISVIVVTIIVTVIANERDRGRTWGLYSDRTKILWVVTFNLILLASEGFAVLQSYGVASPLLATDRVQNVILVKSTLFMLAVGLTIWLFTETLRFLNEDYVETLAEERIVSAIPDAFQHDVQRQQKNLPGLEDETNGL